MTDTFTRQYSEQTVEPEKQGDDQQPFQLQEFTLKASQQKRKFNFDNEIQRDIDPSNIQKAKESVQEVFREAMERLKQQSDDTHATAQREGHEQGYEAGFKAGEEAARQEFTPFLETLQQLVADLSQFRQMMYPKVEREMIEMIVKLTKKVIQTELASREDSIRDVVHLAVRSVLDREEMTIRVNPADKEHTQNYQPELHHLFSEIKNITIEESSSIARGGCLVETNFGTVDARIENLHEQIDRLLQIAPPAVEPPAPRHEVTEASDAEVEQATGEASESDPVETDEPDANEERAPEEPV